MTASETSRLLSAAAHSAQAAAELILVPHHNPLEVESLMGNARSALAFAQECGSLPKGQDGFVFDDRSNG